MHISTQALSQVRGGREARPVMIGEDHQPLNLRGRRELGEERGVERGPDGQAVQLRRLRQVSSPSPKPNASPVIPCKRTAQPSRPCIGLKSLRGS